MLLKLLRIHPKLTKLETQILPLCEVEEDELEIYHINCVNTQEKLGNKNLGPKEKYIKKLVERRIATREQHDTSPFEALEKSSRNLL